MKSILKRFFGRDHLDRQLKKIMDITQQVESYQEQLKILTDEELKHKTLEFRERLGIGATLDELLPEAFGVVREAASRVLGIGAFPVQVMGGIASHRGTFIEMKTGEGKTLTALFPAYLNALTGQGVHVVTANEYLANRDSKEMGEVYRFLGLSVGCLQSMMDHHTRQLAYQCDITYGTNSEFGFDYLRDNLVDHVSKRVQRGHHFAIIDEVDSILIDEARTPLIIADDASASEVLYVRIDQLVKGLQENIHFEMDYTQRNPVLTDEGITLCEKMLNLDNLGTVENMELYHHLLQSIKAHYAYHNNVDYVVMKGQQGLEVVIVDQFTGRLMHGRRYVNGLHQAIEAKEKVEIRKESKILATISFQNYFRKYSKLAGMSGTLISSESEINEIYQAEVIPISTNKPVIRRDFEDLVFPTGEAKWQAVFEDIKDKHYTGRPVLVGTVNIRESEKVSQLLKAEGILHTVLNAKSLEQEAQIISKAGQEGAVTVATNMAGRGTDIKLGEGVAALGGLHVIGTTRHEARRIDEQLRGRAGRQGDPGSSRFYISLEDDLIRQNTPDYLLSAVTKEKRSPLKYSDKRLIELVEKIQKRVENQNSTIRKRLLEFDDVLNYQRETIYANREQVLVGNNLLEYIATLIDQTVSDIVDRHLLPGTEIGERDLIGLLLDMQNNFSVVGRFTLTNLGSVNPEMLKNSLGDQVHEVYRSMEEKMGTEALMNKTRNIMLGILDRRWSEHIDAMEQLRQGIGIRAYGQIQPIHAYIREGRELFEMMLIGLKSEVVNRLFAKDLNSPGIG